MASSYTALGVELMVTGENAGTWGTKTNTNLQLLEQLAGGYLVQTLNAAGAGANTTTLAVTDGGTGATLATRVIILGAASPQTISGNKIVTIPNDVENFYFVKNSTSGGYTVEFQYVSGSGTSVTWGTTSKTWKVISAKADHGTNPNIIEVEIDTVATPAGSTGQVQINNSGAFGAVAEGTSGHILTSNGSGAAPTMQANAGIGIGKAIAMAIVFG